MASVPEVSLQNFYPLLKNATRLIVIFGGAFLATRIVSRYVPKIQDHIVQAMRRHADGPLVELDKRAETLGGIFRKTSAVLIWILAFVMVLREAGFDIGPILAGAGVVGVAVGFGAQSLVRDLIGGLFLLVENQIRVNDVAVINGVSGLVEEINLRTTVLRSLDGTVHVFPNGTINSLANMTRGYSYYVFSLNVTYEEDTDRVVEALKAVAAEMIQEKDYQKKILEPLEVFGVDQFAPSSIVIKARIKTAPMEQWTVGREMNRRIKKRFDELGIVMPFPQQTVHFGDTALPLRVRLDEMTREQLKGLVREVLDEAGSKGWPTGAV
jgi:small conductance mechanosensitive channel